jgi:hypothetical protein
VLVLVLVEDGWMKRLLPVVLLTCACRVTSAASEPREIPDDLAVHLVQVAELDGKWLEWIAAADERLKELHYPVKGRFVKFLEYEAFAAITVTFLREQGRIRGSPARPPDIIIYIDKETSKVIRSNYMK